MRWFEASITAVALSLQLCSCSGDDDPQASIATAVTAPSIAVMTDASGVVGILPDVSCSVAFNDDDKTALVVISNQGWSESERGSVLRFKGVAWVFDGEARRVAASEVAPEDVPEPVLTDVSILYQAPREIDGRLTDGLAVSFTLDSHRVTFVPLHTVLCGTTESVDLSDQPESVVSTKTVYAIDIDPSVGAAMMTVSEPRVDLGGRRILKKMELRSLGVEFYAGGYRLSADVAVPYMGGVARRDYEVRDLVVDVSLFDESTLSYVTSAGYSVKAYFEGVYMR